jgi:phenylacetate-coenzyme A ligase PaaK-like adenylate-forming protein
MRELFKHAYENVLHYHAVLRERGIYSDDFRTIEDLRGLPLFKSLEGRTYEYFVASDGSVLFLKDLDIFFEGLPVNGFQVVQRRPGEILVKLVKANGYSEKDRDFVKRNILWNNFQGTMKVEVKIVESIPSESSGRKRYLIDEVREDEIPREFRIRALKN